MKILILGATGRVGQALVKQALADQHEVVAFVRAPEKVDPTVAARLNIVEGNILNRSDIAQVMTSDIDVVLSALNTDKNDTLSRSMPHLIHAMEAQGLSRLITIGTAGILDSRIEPELFRFQSRESKRRSTTAAEDHLAAFQAINQSNLNWTVVCPTYLPDGEETGRFRTEENVLPENGKKISVGDTAAFAYSLIKQDAYIKTRVGLAY